MKKKTLLAILVLQILLLSSALGHIPAPLVLPPLGTNPNGLLQQTANEGEAALAASWSAAMLRHLGQVSEHSGLAAIVNWLRGIMELKNQSEETYTQLGDLLTGQSVEEANTEEMLEEEAQVRTFEIFAHNQRTRPMP